MRSHVADELLGAGERLLALVPPQVRLGPVYRRYRRFLRESSRWNVDRLRQYQAERLLDLLRFARRTVPFYSHRIPANIERVRREDAFRALEDVPLLSKADLSANTGDLWSRSVPRWRRRIVTTGGSTGVPVEFGIDRGTSVIEWAFITDIWSRIGYRDGDRRLMVRGVVMHGATLRDRPLLDELQLSAFHVSDERLAPVWDRISRFEPLFVHGYPSAIAELVAWMTATGRRLDSVRGVLCGSEPLLPNQRRVIEDGLGVAISHWYGLSERIVLAGDCAHDRSFHVFPQYGVTETVDPSSGRRAAGERGEIVGTGFLTRSMPLIRYRTGDLGRLGSDRCGCGLPYERLFDVEGRGSEGFLVGRTGAQISLTAINFHDEALLGITGLQFVQDTPGVAELLLETPSELDDRTEARVHAAFAAKAGDELRVKVRRVDRLERAPSGKVLTIVQKIGTPREE